jgi:hypothetical protein
MAIIPGSELDRLSASRGLLALLFAVNPDANVARAIVQPDAVRLAVCQKLDGIPIDQGYIFQIESEAVTGVFQTEKSLQLRNVFDPDSTRQGEDDSFI